MSQIPDLPNLLGDLMVHAKAAQKLASKVKAPSITTTRAAQRKETDRTYDRIQINRHLHEIHCLAVELGVAAAQPHRYGEKRIAIGFGREELDLRREPRGSAVKESLTDHKPAQVPLTDAQIDRMVADRAPILSGSATVRRLIRDVERAHGITSICKEAGGAI